MPIYFEYNMFCPNDYRQGQLELNDNRLLHYKIMTSTDNSRWFIAATLQNLDTGIITSRSDLSKNFKNYNEVIAYITTLKSRLQNKTIDTAELDMITDFNWILTRYNQLGAAIFDFNQRYINENTNETETSRLSTEQMPRGITPANITESSISETNKK